MAADLDDWIDEPIEVEFVAGEEDSEPPQTRYTLEGADERGILIGYIDERDLSSDYRILFFPWHKIERIHLLTEAYSPKCVEWAFSEVGQEFIGNSSPSASVGALANWRG